MKRKGKDKREWKETKDKYNRDMKSRSGGAGETKRGSRRQRNGRDGRFTEDGGSAEREKQLEKVGNLSNI